MARGATHHTTCNTGNKHRDIRVRGRRLPVGADRRSLAENPRLRQLTQAMRVAPPGFSARTTLRERHRTSTGDRQGLADSGGAALTHARGAPGSRHPEDKAIRP